MISELKKVLSELRMEGTKSSGQLLPYVRLCSFCITARVFYLLYQYTGPASVGHFRVSYCTRVGTRWPSFLFQQCLHDYFHGSDF